MSHLHRDRGFLRALCPKILSLTVTSHSPTRFDVFLSVGTLKNRSFTAFGVSRSEIGIAGRNVTVTPWSGCDEIRFTAFLPFAFVFIETKAVWYYNEVTREVSRRIEGGVIGK